MNQSQRKQTMDLLHAVLAWQNFDSDDEEQDHDEVCDLLHHAVDSMEADTINELVRIVNGGPNLRAV